jgi:small redox-active disulfide protein 2
MRVQVLGSGCKKCNDLYDNARQAVDGLEGGSYTVEKVDDVDVFLRLGVMVTPALVIDDEVVSSGRVIPAAEIARLIQERG